MNELRKAQLCNEWLQYCLSIGWKKADLDALQKIFEELEGWKTFKGYRPCVTR